MTDADNGELTEEELERQRAEALPNREVMSTIEPYQIPTIEPGFGGPGVEPPPPSD